MAASNGLTSIEKLALVQFKLSQLNRVVRDFQLINERLVVSTFADFPNTLKKMGAEFFDKLNTLNVALEDYAKSDSGRSVIIRDQWKEFKVLSLDFQQCLTMEGYKKLDYKQQSALCKKYLDFCKDLPEAIQKKPSETTAITTNPSNSSTQPNSQGGSKSFMHRLFSWASVGDLDESPTSEKTNVFTR